MENYFSIDPGSADSDESSEIQLDFDESPSSDSGDVAASDDGSVHSSDSRISLEIRFSSGSSCVSRQSERSNDRGIDFKKKSDFGGPLSTDSGDVAASDDDSVHSSDTEISLKSRFSSGSSCVSRKSERSNGRFINFKKKLDFDESPSSDSEDVAASDDDSVHSSDTEKASSGSSCASSQSEKSYNCSTTFKKKEKEKTSPPTTQQLVAGSCAGMETKSVDLPVAVPTSPLTTIQPADASTPPLPATRDKDKSRWGT